MASTDPNRPNFLVITSDDQGPWAMGCAGNDELITPNLDRLAAEGTRFEQFFSASPVCSPARASILTGRLPSAHGVHDWIRGEAYGIPDEGGVHYLEGLTTTPEALANAGWRCGMVGKWHLGTTRSPAPGFSTWYAHRTGDGPYYGAPISTPDGARSEDRYFTDAVTQETVSFLAAAAAEREPFYLSVNFTAPHSPWVNQHPQRFLGLYVDCDFTSCPQGPVHPWFSWEPGPISDAVRDPRRSLQGYFASITAMDEGVGRIVAELDARGLADSTVVVFLSDNGFSCGHHGVWGKGNATWPLNLWENSVKVPAIIRQPGHLAQGRTTTALASACDLHPTILALAGVDVPYDPLAAGDSLVPLLRDEAPAQGHREVVYSFAEYGSARMIRTADAKLILREGDLPDEFYDLAADPGEEHDLIGDRSWAPRVTELRQALLDWFSTRSESIRDAVGRQVSGRGQLLRVTESAPDELTYYQGAGERRTRAGDSARGQGHDR